MAKDGKTFFIWLVVIVVGIYLLAPNVLTDLFSATGGGVDSGADAGTPDIDACVGVEDVTLTISSAEKYNPSATVDGSHRLLIKTDGYWIDVGYVEEDGTTTLSVGDQFEIIMRENSSTHYPVLMDGIAGYPDGATNCRGTHRVFAELLDYDTAFNTVIITDKDGSLNGEGAYDIGAGATATSQVLLEATSEDGFGSPGAGLNLLVCEYNKTEVDSLTLKGTDVTTTGVSLPQVHTNIIAGSPGYAVVGFPPVENLQEIVVDVTIEMDSSYGTPVSDINCTLYDTTFFRDPDTNEVTSGVEDSTGTDKGQTSSTDTFGIDLT